MNRTPLLHAFVCLLLPLAAGCSGDAGNRSAMQGVERSETMVGSRKQAAENRQTERAQQQNAPNPSTRPTAVIDGRGLNEQSFRAACLEFAGGQVLAEHVLAARVVAELTNSGRTLNPSDVEAERRLVEDMMAGESGLPGSAVRDRIAELRRQRGLGPTRWNMLIETSAGLRALVRDTVTISPQELATAMEVASGERVNARIIVVETQETASALRSQMQGLNGDPLRTAFAAAAFDRSVDESSLRGGLVRNASPADPAIARAIGAAMKSQPIGELGPVLVLEKGFGLVLVESRTPGPGGADRSSVERRLRTQAERIAMDALARRLISGQGVTVFDADARWSWDALPR